MRDGAVVGQRYHHGVETGEQSFDVVIGEKVAGLLVEGRRVVPAAEGQYQEIRIWRLSQATGCLEPLVGREWDDGRLLGEVGSFDFAWPDAALAGIRAELERP